MLRKFAILITILSASLSTAWAQISTETNNRDSSRIRAILVNGKTFIGPVTNSDLKKINTVFAERDSCTEALKIVQEGSDKKDQIVTDLQAINTGYKKVVQGYQVKEEAYKTSIQDKDAELGKVYKIAGKLDRKLKGLKISIGILVPTIAAAAGYFAITHYIK